MRKRHEPQEKPPARSLWHKVGLGLATLALAGAAVFQTFTVLAQKRNPALVLGLAPGNAVANSRLSSLALGALTPESDFEALVGSSARRSIQSQGLNPPAIRQLALLALLQNDEPQARRLFDLSESLSHRDLPTSLFQYEIAYRMGRTEEAVEQFDNAVRTSARGREHLLPQAVTFLENSAWRAGIARQLRGKPDWSADFWNVAINDPERVVETAQLRLALPADDRYASENVTRAIIRNLLRDGHIDLAVKMFNGLEKNAATHMASNLDFSEGKWPPFSWEASTGGEFIAARQKNGDALTLTVLPGASHSLLARRLTGFAPGRYIVGTRATFETPMPEGLLSLLVTCAEGNNVLARIDLATAGRDGNAAARVTIPQSCSEQWLRLESTPNAASQVFSGTITPPVMRLVPTNGS